MITTYLMLSGFLTAGLLMATLTLTCWSLGATLMRKETGTTRADITALGILAMALAIGIGVDLVRVEGDISRMNTLFKYYLVAWLLFGVSGAYGIWRGWHAWRSQERSHLRDAGTAIVVITCVIAVGTMVYPVLGTHSRLHNRFNIMPLTLDGSAWMHEATHQEGEVQFETKWDADAIGWMQDNVQGSPVVLEAHGEQYHWNSRISAYTGLPTVLGWPWHQIQQRGDWELIRRRTADIAETYSTANMERKRELLEKYNIEYVVIGDLERIYYDAKGLEKFPQMTDKVYDNGHTAIYAVRER